MRRYAEGVPELRVDSCVSGKYWGARTVNRREAICVIESMLDGSTVLTAQAVNAMVLSLEALKHPEKISCGGCSLFKDEDAYGDGMCSKHQKTVNCTDQDCMDYE